MSIQQVKQVDKTPFTLYKNDTNDHKVYKQVMEIFIVDCEERDQGLQVFYVAFY